MAWQLRSALEIAIKDLTVYSRSRFIWAMMLVAPLLIAGLIYFAFSGLGSSSGGFQVPVTRVQVANLDQPTAQSGGFSAGQMLVEFLQNDDLAGLVQVAVASDEASARSAVDTHASDVALIIPANLTTAVFALDQEAAIVLYQDPTVTIGPGVVKGLVENYLDSFSGGKIALGVVARQLSERGMAVDNTIVQNTITQYAAWIQSLLESRQAGDYPAMRIQSPPGKAVAANSLADLAGKILAGQLIFFAFYTAAATAQSIITEEEQLTLGRLFTTPTPRTTILSGKFMGVFLLVLGQVLVLTAVSSVLFRIHWGQPLSVLMAILGLVAVTTGLGLFLMSFVKNSRQAGAVFGGVLTVLGMAGGLFTAANEGMPRAFETIALLTPHGWALRAWKLSLAGADARAMLLPVAVLLVMGAVLFVGGALTFRRRLS